MNVLVFGVVLLVVNVLIGYLVYSKLDIIQTQTDGKLSRLELLNATLQARLDEALAERGRAVQEARQEGRDKREEPQ